MNCKLFAATIGCALLLAGTAVPQDKQEDRDRNENKPADNTGKNVRDRSDQAITPGDQSGTKEDREITRKIRREVVKTDGFSTVAKNVKIVTRDGKVTLRGPVNTTEEREQIAAIAKKVDGVSSVDNQLELKEKK